MSTRQQRIEFATMAYEAGWPDDRVEAWMYCNTLHNTPLPHPSWTRDQIQSTSDAVLETYLRDEREQLAEGGINQDETTSLSPFMYGIFWLIGYVFAFLFVPVRKNS